MANAWYTDGKAGVSDGSVAWATDDIRVVLVDLNRYTFNAGHRSLSSIPAGARSVAVKLCCRTKVGNICDASDPVFGVLSFPRKASALVVYKHNDDSALALLLVFIDTATGLPVFAGSDVHVTWENTGSKLANWNTGDVGTPTVTQSAPDDEWIAYAQNQRNRTSPREIRRTKSRAKVLMMSQNEWYTQPIAGAVSGVNVAVTISGTFFAGIGSPGITDIESFIVATDAQISARIAQFQNNHADVAPTTKGIILMDIEDVASPSGMHQYSDATQDRIFAAFRSRVRLTRQAFPNARLAIYGGSVDGQGDASDATQILRARALERAGAGGMFDGVDFLAPVLYARFGPNDTVNSWASLGAYTHLGIATWRRVRQSNGTALPILPLVTYWIANGNSVHNDGIIADFPITNPAQATLGVQMDMFAAMGVTEILFWSGVNEDLITAKSNPNNKTVSEHVLGMIA